MAIRVQINRLGRIGKLLTPLLIDRDDETVQPVPLNDAAGDPATHAHFLEFDTLHGRWTTPFGPEADALRLAVRRVQLSQARRLEELPLGDLGGGRWSTAPARSRQRPSSDPVSRAAHGRSWCRRGVRSRRAQRRLWPEPRGL